ncbi:putative transposase [Paraburkholderia sp. EB58]|uniref:IS6 family transposase n=1 Tax=Paraburkholderia sp. EB58 TaxID=3035125 RepID=UPI003D20BAF8
MARFDLYANPDDETRRLAPFLLDVQITHVGILPTRIVIPLRPVHHLAFSGKPSDLLPVFEISRNLEEMMAERGFEVDDSSVHRWVIKLVRLFEKAFRRHKRPVGKNWRVDDTYVKVRGQWKYMYRGVDKAGNTVDFLLCANRDKAAARRYFEKAIDRNGAPETVTTDKSGANLAALQAINAERETPIKVRQVKYLNNIVEQDHRAIKRRTRAMMGFNDFRCARIILSGMFGRRKSA